MTIEKRTESIQIWSFEDAPEDFQELSENGGDEDWLMRIPKSLTGDNFPYWLEALWDRALDVQVIPLEDGSEVHIGSHA